MKKVNRKRLNNKGFTLIELLAVVVILAVVMGIAMNSVLTSMNKSRGGSLSDSAQVVAQGMVTKYTEVLVDGVPDSVYGKYDLTADAVYYLDSDVAKKDFNLSDAYVASSKDKITVSGNAATVNASFFTFDASTGKIVVCLVAKPSGNVYVAGYTTKTTASINGTTFTFSQVDSKNAMFACSDGNNKSW